jgi:hypothetical protein
VLARLRGIQNTYEPTACPPLKILYGVWGTPSRFASEHESEKLSSPARRAEAFTAFSLFVIKLNTFLIRDETMKTPHVHESKWQEAIWKLVVIAVVFLLRVIESLSTFFKCRFQLLLRRRAVVEKP